MCFSLEKS